MGNCLTREKLENEKEKTELKNQLMREVFKILYFLLFKMRLS